jgi:putative aldouronate transport system permease protein
MNMGRSWGSRLFDISNTALLLLVTLICFLPFAYVVASSFSSTDTIIPQGFSLVAYEYIFSTGTLMRSLGVSIYITVLGTAILFLRQLWRIRSLVVP